MTILTIKLGGALLQDPAHLDRLADQLAELVEGGKRPCLVHGGGHQISQALAQASVPDERCGGLRVTPPEAAEVVQATMDELGADLAAALAQRGLDAFHVPSTDGRLFATPKAPELGLGRVGTPTRFEDLGLPGPVGGPVPVVTPVGTDGHGPLNVNADEGAAAIAAGIGSDRLILATDVEGVLGPDGAPIGELSPRRARTLIEEGTAAGGMIPKLEAALTALADGVPHVHITSLAHTLPAGPASHPHGTHLSAAQGVLA